MKKLLLATTALAALAAPVKAADLPVKAPPVAAIYNWTGCYIGVAGGGAWGRSKHDLTGAAVDTGPFDVSGGLFGGTLGCNWQSSRIVFGIEGDGSWVDKNGSAPNPATPNFISETRENWLATVRGRVGITLTDRWLAYATGGAAFAGVEARATDTTGPVTITERRTRTGFAVGGGTEWGLTPNWSVKAEYLFVRFSKDAYFTPPPAAGFTARDDVTLNNHIFRVGINYRWGGPIVASY